MSHKRPKHPMEPKQVCTSCLFKFRKKGELCNYCYHIARMESSDLSYAIPSDMIVSQNLLETVRKKQLATQSQMIPVVLKNTTGSTTIQVTKKALLGISNNASVVLYKGGKVLVVLETNAKGNKELGFPGGSRLKNENLSVTALRELLEETGITISKFDHVDLIVVPKSGSADGILVASATEIQTVGTTNFIEWIDLGFLKSCIERIRMRQDPWFEIKDNKLVEINESTNPADKVRFRQCTKNGFSEAIASLETHISKKPKEL